MALKDMVYRLTAGPDDSTEPECENFLTEANESIISVEQYLAGSRSDWIKFDDDDLSADTPASCL